MYINIKARFVITSLAFLFLGSCATKKKPVLSMIYASAALKAAARSGAEKKAPDSFRKAELSFWSAKRYYLIKNYKKAEQAAEVAKVMAEKSEVLAEIKQLLEDDDEDF